MSEKASTFRRVSGITWSEDRPFEAAEELGCASEKADDQLGSREDLVGETNPWEYRLEPLQQCGGAKTDSSTEKRLEVEGVH